MCLILFAHGVHDDYPLVVAANRDEYYARPTEIAGFWDACPQLLAGRDLRAGGTWLGLTRDGRFAAITNYRSGPRVPSQQRSRGELTLAFLQGSTGPREYAEQVMTEADAFSGFNLLVGQIGGDNTELVYCNNLNMSVQALEPGVYGLSNHLLDTGWPKVQRGKQALRDLLNTHRGGDLKPESLLNVLADNTRAPDKELPSTGIELTAERELSPIFIESAHYGTCCSTAVIVDKNRDAVFQERSFYRDDKRKTSDDVLFRFSLES